MDTYTLRIQLISNKPNYNRCASFRIYYAAFKCALCTMYVYSVHCNTFAKPTHVWYALDCIKCASVHLSDYYYYWCIFCWCSISRRLLFRIHLFTLLLFHFFPGSSACFFFLFFLSSKLHWADFSLSWN